MMKRLREVSAKYRSMVIDPYICELRNSAQMNDSEEEKIKIDKRIESIRDAFDKTCMIFEKEIQRRFISDSVLTVRPFHIIFEDQLFKKFSCDAKTEYTYEHYKYATHIRPMSYESMKSELQENTNNREGD